MTASHSSAMRTASTTGTTIASPGTARACRSQVRLRRAPRGRRGAVASRSTSASRRPRASRSRRDGAPRSARGAGSHQVNEYGEAYRHPYQWPEPEAAVATDFVTRPARPVPVTASRGTSPVTSETTPNTPTSTSANGSIRMNRRYASAPAMMPPPTLESRSIPVSVTSTALWGSRSAASFGRAAADSSVPPLPPGRLLAVLHGGASMPFRLGGWRGCQAPSLPDVSAEGRPRRLVAIPSVSASGYPEETRPALLEARDRSSSCSATRASRSSARSSCRTPRP